MAELTLYREQSADFTVISNLFIDQYMKDANDAQLKVYLYLLRMLSAGGSTSVSDIADKFNHTETEVLRSLRYWEKRGLLSLEYDRTKSLTGIRVNSLHSDSETPAPMAKESTRSLVLCAESVFPPSTEISLQEPLTPPESPKKNLEAIKQLPKEGPSFSKPVYSTDQLREFKSRENTAQLLFIAEQYIGRPLTPSEMKTILFFTDELHFSDDLIDYLLQYCVDRDKKDFKYIEKVAINWAQEGITTPKEAQRTVGKYDKNIYAIMRELGKDGSPTNTEMEFINRWIREYSFPLDIILTACQRTVLSTDKNRFKYAEGILKSWRESGVHCAADIRRLDEQHQREPQQKKKAASKPGYNNSFNQFTQNNYDFAELEKILISNK